MDRNMVRSQPMSGLEYLCLALARKPQRHVELAHRNVLHIELTPQSRQMEHEFRQNKVSIRIANLSQNILGSAAQFAHKSERSWDRTWAADPDKIIAAVRRGHQVLDSIH
jgi:hypothetical protein